MSTTDNTVNTSEVCERIVNLILAGDSQGEELLVLHFFAWFALPGCQALPRICGRLLSRHDPHRHTSDQRRSTEDSGCPARLYQYRSEAHCLEQETGIRAPGRERRSISPLSYKPDPMTAAIPSECWKLRSAPRFLRDGLRSLKPQEQEILTRFYLKGEKPEYICAANEAHRNPVPTK